MTGGVGGAASLPRQVAAERRDGAAPALVDGRVDQADVGFDAAAAARDLRRRRPGGRRAPRSPRPSRRRRARGRRDGRAATMWRALSSSASSACSATCVTHSGRVASSLRSTWRASAVAVAASARAISCWSASSCSPTERTSAPTCVVVWLREALLESFERDQSVAIAVLVARLARRAQLLRVQLGRIDRRARPRARAGPGAAPARDVAERPRLERAELLARNEAGIEVARRGARAFGGGRDGSRLGGSHAGASAARGSHRRCRRRSRAGLPRPGGARS